MGACILLAPDLEGVGEFVVVHAGFAPGLAKVDGVRGSFVGGLRLLCFQVVVLAVQGFTRTCKALDASVLPALR